MGMAERRCKTWRAAGNKSAARRVSACRWGRLCLRQTSQRWGQPRDRAIRASQAARAGETVQKVQKNDKLQQDKTIQKRKRSLVGGAGSTHHHHHHRHFGSAASVEPAGLFYFVVPARVSALGTPAAGKKQGAAIGTSRSVATTKKRRGRQLAARRRDPANLRVCCTAL